LAKLCAPYFRSTERRWTVLILSVIIVFTLGTVVISAFITYWYQGFYNALQSYNKTQIWHEVGVFAILAAFWVVANVLQQYFMQVFQNRWRRWLTVAFVHRWMTRHTYYRMQIADYGAHAS
jgi:putative ATP-binding cassette transporter